MKKSVLCVFVMLVIAGATRAQLNQGNFLIGGDIANLRLGLDKGNPFSATLDPKLAFFIRDNVALGAYLKFGILTAKDAGTDINYGVGALGRYYISDPSVNVLRHSRFFFEGTVGIEGYNPAEGDNTNGLGIGVGPGLAYFISPNVGLETMLKYNGIVGFGQRVTTNELNLSVGLQIYLGANRVRERVKEEKRANQ